MNHRYIDGMNFLDDVRWLVGGTMHWRILDALELCCSVDVLSAIEDNKDIDNIYLANFYDNYTYKSSYYQAWTYLWLLRE